MKNLDSPYKNRIKQLRQVRAPDEDHNSNWAISYGDMITLLLAFFVIFFNTSKTDESLEKLKSLVDQEFGQTSIDRNPDAATWGQVQADKLAEVTTRLTGDKLIVEFPQTSFFNSAEFELTEEGKSILSKFAKTYQDFTVSNRLIVRGYTDNRPVRGGRYRYQDNLELSSLRAISALRVLNKEGIPFEIMRIGGYGESDKAEKVSDAEILKYDRKIVLVIEPLDKTERGIFQIPEKFGRAGTKQGDRG